MTADNLSRLSDFDEFFEFSAGDFDAFCASTSSLPPSASEASVSTADDLEQERSDPSETDQTDMNLDEDASALLSPSNEVERIRRSCVTALSQLVSRCVSPQELPLSFVFYIGEDRER